MLSFLLKLFMAILEVLLFTLFSMQTFVAGLIRSEAVRFLIKFAMRSFLIATIVGFTIKLVEYSVLIYKNRVKNATELQEALFDKLNILNQEVRKNLPTLLYKILLGVLLGASLLAFNLLVFTIINALAPGFLVAASSTIGSIFSASMNFAPTVFYAPIFEEIVFRYMLIEGLKKVGNGIWSACAFVTSTIENITGYTTTWFKGNKVELVPNTTDNPTPKTREINKSCIVASALLFSAGHSGGLAQNIATFFGGLMLGYLYEKDDGDLTAPIAAHMTNNAIVYAATRGALRI